MRPINQRIWTICVLLTSMFLPVLAYAQAPPARQFKANDYLPECSTEKVNGNCFINVDRMNPITMPTIHMKRGAKITVYVFHPLAFEALTLDPGTAQAFEGSDQAAAIANALVPVAKGAVFGLTGSYTMNSANLEAQSTTLMGTMMSELESSPAAPTDPDRLLAEKIRGEIEGLNKTLTNTLAPLASYIHETNVIYATIREIESPAPRPFADLQATSLRAADVPSPWDKYGDWRTAMMAKIVKQGQDTENVYNYLPVACQTAGSAPPPIGPWLPPARQCIAPNTTTQPSPTPLAIPASFNKAYSELTNNLGNLPVDKPDKQTYQSIQLLKQTLDDRKQQVDRAIESYPVVLPGILTKVSGDMQTLLTNISLAVDNPSRSPVEVGVIPSPVSAHADNGEEKVLAPYNQLAPQTTFTLNAQNEIANPLMSLPSSTQKQAIVTITLLYAEPKLEVSAGAFLSWLNNPTFSNNTDVTITNGSPTPTDIKIIETKTTRPLIIPFAAGNYRISPEFTWPDWLGGRRGALYGTLGIGLNPYDTQVEYFAGFSLSWRYLMISPVYHLGHGSHLTQGEQVGQIWCQYGGTASATSSPPLCAGPPPAPSTKSFWTGAFALGISVRIPTTFNSTNQ
jgi:hypothetical protein